MTKDQILAALPKLSQADLGIIIAAAMHLQAATGTQANQPAGLGHAIFNALGATVGAFVPYESFAVTKTARQLEIRLPDLEKFLNKEFPGWDVNKLTQTAFLRMLVNLIANDLTGRGVKPTFGSVVINLHRLPDIFDDAFPHYLINGLGPLVLKNFQK